MVGSRSLIPWNRKFERSSKIYHFGDGSNAWSIFSIWIQHDMPSEHALLWGSAFNLTKSPCYGDISFSGTEAGKDLGNYINSVYRINDHDESTSGTATKALKELRSNMRKNMPWLLSVWHRFSCESSGPSEASTRFATLSSPHFKRPAGRTCDTRTFQPSSTQ